MPIRPRNRARLAALLMASTVVAVAGCSASRRMGTSQPSGEDAAPKKEYQWQDLSTGKANFRPIGPSSQD